LLPIDDPAVRHCLLVAIVAINLGRQSGLAEARVESLACAALTMNLGALHLHADLANGAERFDEHAREGIQRHPEHSARLLEASWVRDPDWLAAVRQHHENLDGSGYPLGLRGGEIDAPARLIRVVDYFIAKISGRRNRQPRSARFALRMILLEGDRERLDTRFAQHLLHRYGLYPVGTLVRLENREIAVITRNSGRCGNASMATSFMRQRGRFLAFPVERDISAPGYAVIDVLERDAHRSRFPWEMFWQDWS
jgi:HD-GYP domain-containing protein (c-di-GMP phosphodiesterase class II)